MVSRFSLHHSSGEPPRFDWKARQLCHCLQSFRFSLSPKPVFSAASLLMSMEIQSYPFLSSKSLVSFVMLSFCHTLHLNHQQILLMRFLTFLCPSITQATIISCLESCNRLQSDDSAFILVLLSSLLNTAARKTQDPEYLT